MAEAILRHLGKENFRVYSAGLQKTFVKPNTIKVLEEIGIDVSGQESKTWDKYLDKHFDEVITLCDEAEEVCPFFPNAKNRRHWGFPNPKNTNEFRNVRDGIIAKIKDELGIQ